MDTNDDRKKATGVLQKLGLREYEAKCFVALTRLPKATAKQLADAADVPRTRVYEAVRRLQEQGLVEVQHSSPQQFRAVPLDEAVETLRERYDSRVELLYETLSDLDREETDTDEAAQEVWSLTDSQAIATRTNQLVEGATAEVVLVLGAEEDATDALVAALADALDRGVNVDVGTPTERLQRRLASSLDGADVFVSGLDWLRGTDGEVSIGRMLLVDGNEILVSTVGPETDAESAVTGRGFANGLVVIARRLLATGLGEGA